MIEAEQNNMIKCPKCDSEYVSHIHRGYLMRMFTSWKRFICSDCGKIFYSPPIIIRRLKKLLIYIGSDV